MTESNEQYDEGRINAINDDLIEKKVFHGPNNKIIYILFAITIILILGGFALFIFFYLKKDDPNPKSEIYAVNPKTNAEIVTLFFKDGYQYKNYDKVMDYMVENYIDHSPANARSNSDAVAILKIVGNMFSNVTVEMLDLICEKDMVAARIWYKMVHTGEYNKIPATGKTITFEALENFKVVNGKITESWGYWPEDKILQQIKGE